MWWMAAAQGAMGYLNNQAARAEADANNMLSALNAKTGNATRLISNNAEKAKGDLARWTQSVNNNRRLASGANNLEAVNINYQRQMDNLGAQDFSRSISDAEQSGAQAAARGSSGIVGNVTDMVAGATALRAAIIGQNAAQNKQFLSYDTARQAGGILSNMVTSLDNSVIMDNLDYNVDVAKVQPKLSNFAAVLKAAGPALMQAAGSMGNPSPIPTKALDYSMTDAAKQFRFNTAAPGTSEDGGAFSLFTPKTSYRLTSR